MTTNIKHSSKRKHREIFVRLFDPKLSRKVRTRWRSTVSQYTPTVCKTCTSCNQMTYVELVKTLLFIKYNCPVAMYDSCTIAFSTSSIWNMPVQVL